MSRLVTHKSGTICTRRRAGYTNRHYPITALDDNQVTCIVCLREMLKQRNKQAAINILVEKQRRFGTVIFDKARIEQMVNRAEAIGNLWEDKK